MPSIIYVLEEVKMRSTDESDIVCTFKEAYTVRETNRNPTAILRCE